MLTQAAGEKPSFSNDQPWQPHDYVRIAHLVAAVEAAHFFQEHLVGPLGQAFQGATFLADQRYRAAIQAAAERVGGVLAGDGVVGCFSVDFLVRPQAGKRDEIFAVDINLRHGGTTHCFNMLKFITDGNYDGDTGRFFDQQGHERV